MASVFRAARPLLHCLPPEMAHALGLWALRSGLLPTASLKIAPSLATEVFGLRFANPLGLAAGFDKNAVAVDALLGQGLGFVEAGTVTPKPQPGNPKPRVFRLSKDEAVINRLGFPGDGLEKFMARIQKHDASKGIMGINIVKNRNSTDAVTDYIICLRAVYPYADYVAVNVSSPNTPGLRDLQRGEALEGLLAALQQARGECTERHGVIVPLLLKVAPDLSAQEKKDIAALALAQRLDGLIVSNTTVSRPESLRSRYKTEKGGLSGRPLFSLSTEALRDFYRLTGGKIPLVGVGGIASAEDAYAKIRAGATLLQLYTAIVYQGFGVVREITDGLSQLVEKDGFAHISDAVGIDAG